MHFCIKIGKRGENWRFSRFGRGGEDLREIANLDLIVCFIALFSHKPPNIGYFMQVYNHIISKIKDVSFVSKLTSQVGAGNRT